MSKGAHRPLLRDCVDEAESDVNCYVMCAINNVFMLRILLFYQGYTDLSV